MSQIEIARYLWISPPSAMQLVKRLEREGFVRRKRDTCDGRRMIVSLTEPARAQIIAMRRTLIEGMDHIEAQMAEQGYTGDDMERCKALLRAFMAVDRSALRQTSDEVSTSQQHEARG